MKCKNKLYLPIIAITTMLVMNGMNLNAQDWSQWRGSNQDGIVKNANLNLDWSVKKPLLSWTFRQAGLGYSSPAIVGTTLYCQGAMDGIGFAFALDTKTGSQKWKKELGAESVEDRENAPRGTITVNGDKLYLIRGLGQIHCLSAIDGREIWQKDFTKDFEGKMMSKWGYSESPLVDGNRVICTPGGAKGTMVALDKNSGIEVWRCKEWSDEAGYSSPIVAEIDGVRQYIQQSAKGVAGVAAKDGKLLWRVEVEGYRVAVIPTPIYKDNVVYVTAGYGGGCHAIKLSKTGDKFNTEIVYANKNMANHHGGVVLLDGHIYGFSDGSGWVCQNFKTGDVVWKQRVREVGKGAVLAVNDRLLLQDERTGLLTVVAASPNGWKEFGRMELPEQTKIESVDNMIWVHPVIANGKLYVRDHDLLFCFDLQK